MSACVTLDEVLAAAHARCASLVPETSGYLALAVSDATSRLPLRLDDRAVLLTTEGTVTVRTRGEPVAPAEAARLLRDLLARLLAASAGSMPNLATTARPRPASEQDPDAVARELEAALIPVNRNAARRALARLARETLRAKEAGRLKRARSAAQARPAALEASEEAAAGASAARAPAPGAHDEVAARGAVVGPRADEAAGAARGQEASAARAEIAGAPLAPAVVQLTLSPGPVAPAVVELTLSPGLVASATSGQTAPASAIAGDAAEAAAAAEASGLPSEIAPESGHATHIDAQVEVIPEPTPTVVQAVVEIEMAGAPAEIPAIPELIEPARSIAPVAPIALAATPAPAVAAVAPAEERAAPASSPLARDAASCGHALTSPEGIEVFLVELSPEPARVAPPSQEPTPTQSILVEFSPEPAGVAPLSQEPTPTVATAVWAERMAPANAAVASGADAPDAAADAPDAPDAAADAPDAAADAPDAAADAPTAVTEAAADVFDAAGDAPVDVADVPADAPVVATDVAADAPVDVADVAADAPVDVADIAADAPVVAADVPADAVETARAPAIHVLLEAASALQVTPAYGGWPLVHRSDVAAASAHPRASIAPVEETPAARHTLPWPIPSHRADDAPGAPAPAALTAPPPASEAPVSARAGAPPTDAAPVEEPCPAGLDPVDAIVWSASRRSRSARPPADGAGPSRVDELVARFVAQSEHSAQRRAARSMKALAGLDPTLTPPPVTAISALEALKQRSPLTATRPPVPSESAALGALDESSRPPAPLVAPRRRGLSLWLALVALALLCAVLVGTLRPELFASLAEPLARGALHAVPRAEARTPPPHD
ncbi:MULTISPECIES: hypothetical protein [Sorangium]|uniref:hypothetical protein n=1 Tax=Sorangium TaxID=39643 RepID=UPI003D9C085E